MATIRGFISMLGFADNRPNYVAQFGEFSTVVSTYSRDIQFFSKDTLPGVTFSALYSVDDASPWQITSTVGEQILTVGKWVYDQYNANLIPRNTSKAAFIAALTTQFPSLSNFVVGTLLAGPTSTKNMPDYVRFDIGQVHSVQVWFADSAIKEIIVTDSIPHPAGILKKLTVVSIAPLLSETIRRVHTNESVSSLF